MKIFFQKKDGNHNLGIDFFWRMQIDADSPTLIEDNLIPELFFDYLYIQTGSIHASSADDSTSTPLPMQVLKTLHSGSIVFQLYAPIVLFGVRLELGFANLIDGNGLPPNRCLKQNWITQECESLAQFAVQVTDHLARMQKNRPVNSLLSLDSNPFEEPDWLKPYSQRHKRRLHKNRFGLSRKEMLTIQNVHRFLEQSCDFSSDYPHIIDHVNDEQYYDQPHLNRAFKKVTGFTLLEYFEANTMLQDNLMAVSYKDDWG